MVSKRSLSEPEDVVDFLAGPGLARLKDFLVSQRWFAAKTHGIHTVEVEDWTELEPDGPTLLLLLRVDGERYYTPLSVSASAEIAAADVAGRLEGQAPMSSQASDDSSSPPSRSSGSSPAGPAGSRATRCPRPRRRAPRTRWLSVASRESRAIPRSSSGVSVS
jgi:hypothetical protein